MYADWILLGILLMAVGVLIFISVCMLHDYVKPKQPQRSTWPPVRNPSPGARAARSTPQAQHKRSAWSSYTYLLIFRLSASDAFGPIVLPASREVTVSCRPAELDKKKAEERAALELFLANLLKEEGVSATVDVSLLQTIPLDTTRTQHTYTLTFVLASKEAVLAGKSHETHTVSVCCEVSELSKKIAEEKEKLDKSVEERVKSCGVDADAVIALQCVNVST